MTRDDVQPGKYFRARRPRISGWDDGPILNDRKVLHVGISGVQYDSPSVANGRHFPTVTMEKFLAWAGQEITPEQYTRKEPK
ncbi:MAG: hypothetical protein JO250_09240 [Armatimonadetes bacterium]|nr:hypothetical protein [Armatimonadota bacterium]